MYFPARDFLCNCCPDHRDLMLDDVLAYTAEKFETDHQFIQWIFPLMEPSPFNPHAPVLNKGECAHMRDDPHVSAGLQRAFVFVLKNYGMTWVDGAVLPLADASRGWMILQSPSHHDKHVSRVLRSLTLLGMRDEALAMLAHLERSYPKSVALSWWWFAGRDRD